MKTSKEPNFESGEYIFCPNQKTYHCHRRVELRFRYKKKESNEREIEIDKTRVGAGCYGSGTDEDEYCGSTFDYTVEEATALVLAEWEADEKAQEAHSNRKQALKNAQCNTPCASCGHVCEEITEEARLSVLDQFPYL